MAPPPGSFGLQALWALLCRRAQLVTVTTLAVVLLAILYVLQVAPQFAATSEVMLDSRKLSLEPSASVLSNLSDDQPSILNQIEILTSYRFAGKVVDRFHLDRDPEFSSLGLTARLLGAPADPRDRAIAALRKKLKVAQAGFSSSIRITLTARERQKAAEIAAAIASIYVQDQLDVKAEASKQANAWLTERVNELAQKVREAESAVQKYKAEHNITITPAGTSVLEAQLADLNTQLTTARTDYDDKAAKAAHIAELARSGQLASAPQVVASSLIASLTTQEAILNRDLANLATKYGPNHPKMQELKAQKADLGAKISQEAQRIADSVRNDADASRTHVASLQKTLAGIEATNARKNEQTVELTALQSAAASARAMYQSFLTQYNQTENQQGILRPDAHVISAFEVQEVFGPQTKLLGVLAAIPAGLLLGLVLAFLTDRGSAPARREPLPAPALEPARASFAIRRLPPMSAGLRLADLVVGQPQAPFAQAVSQILSDILAKAVPPATIVLASPAPGAGKTTLALALARTAACSGIRTIVIDANRPSCHMGGMIGRAAANVWRPAQSGDAGAFIEADPLSPALVMAAAPFQPGYENVLTAAVLNRLIAGFRTSVDLIVVAAPPLNDGLAASLLAQADATILVLDGRRPTPALPSSLARRALTVITQAG